MGKLTLGTNWGRAWNTQQHKEKSYKSCFSRYVVQFSKLNQFCVLERVLDYGARIGVRLIIWLNFRNRRPRIPLFQYFIQFCQPTETGSFKGKFRFKGSKQGQTQNLIKFTNSTIQNYSFSLPRSIFPTNSNLFIWRTSVSIPVSQSGLD